MLYIEKYTLDNALQQQNYKIQVKNHATTEGKSAKLAYLCTSMEKLTIEVDRLKVRAYHGVFPQERAVGNDFEVTLSVTVIPEGISEMADRLDNTVSYADLAGIIREVMGRPVDLLETVALNISREVRGRFPAVTGGRVKVTKLHPPLPQAMAGASIIYEWGDCP